MRELRGERIDIIQFSEDVITYAQNALSPAKITRVSLMNAEDGIEDEGEETMPTLECIVEEDQLSLAIGKRGQNVRLASALIGAKIDIKSEQAVKEQVAQALQRMLLASQRRGTALAEIARARAGRPRGARPRRASRPWARSSRPTAARTRKRPAASTRPFPTRTTALDALDALRAFESAPAEEEPEEEEGDFLTSDEDGEDGERPKRPTETEETEETEETDETEGSEETGEAGTEDASGRDGERARGFRAGDGEPREVKTMSAKFTVAELARMMGKAPQGGSLPPAGNRGRREVGRVRSRPRDRPGDPDREDAGPEDAHRPPDSPSDSLPPRESSERRSRRRRGPPSSGSRSSTRGRRRRRDARCRRARRRGRRRRRATGRAGGAGDRVRRRRSRPSPFRWPRLPSRRRPQRSQPVAEPRPRRRPGTAAGEGSVQDQQGSRPSGGTAPEPAPDAAEAARAAAPSPAPLATARTGRAGRPRDRRARVPAPEESASAGSSSGR